MGAHEMTDILTRACPACGARLEITPDLDRFACAHCGHEHIVPRSAGVVSIRPLQDALTGLQRATDRAAAELGLRRANDELARIEARHWPIPQRRVSRAAVADGACSSPGR